MLEIHHPIRPPHPKMLALLLAQKLTLGFQQPQPQTPLQQEPPQQGLALHTQMQGYVLNHPDDWAEKKTHHHNWPVGDWQEHPREGTCEVHPVQELFQGRHRLSGTQPLLKYG